jgi:UDP-glucose 4-epimerase
MPITQSEFFAGQSILVTGGAGFIGSHLVESLIATGAKVTVVDNLCTGRLGNLKNCLNYMEYIQDDILSDTYHSMLTTRAFDGIFHLAGNAYVPPSVEHPWHDFQANAVGTFRLLDSLRQSGWPVRVIVLSSAAVYGNLDSTSISEDDPTVPISPYGVSKLTVDRYAAVYARLYGLQVASLRLFSAYGPRQQKQVVYDFIHKLTHNPAELHASGDGTQVRDFSYVTDVVQAALCVAQNGPLQGETYNVASGEACSTQQLLDTLCELMGVRPRIRWSGTNRPGDTQRWLANVDRLQALGYRPSVPLREGVQRTLAWYQTEMRLANAGETQ